MIAQAEAQRMVLDLSDCMDTVISLAEEQDMSGRAMAIDTLITLKTMRDKLRHDLLHAKVASRAERDLDVLRQVSEQRGGES